MEHQHEIGKVLNEMPRQKSYDVEPFSVIRAATEKDNYPTTTISL